MRTRSLRPLFAGSIICRCRGNIFMSTLGIVLACLVALCLAAVLTALALAASSPPRIEDPRDVFGFSSLKTGTPRAELLALQRYVARDGEELAYRFYESPAD